MLLYFIIYYIYLYTSGRFVLFVIRRDIFVILSA